METTLPGSRSAPEESLISKWKPHCLEAEVHQKNHSYAHGNHTAWKQKCTRRITHMHMGTTLPGSESAPGGVIQCTLLESLICTWEPHCLEAKVHQKNHSYAHGNHTAWKRKCTRRVTHMHMGTTLPGSESAPGGVTQCQVYLRNNYSNPLLPGPEQTESLTAPELG